jgi:hypothetical protein
MRMIVIIFFMLALGCGCIIAAYSPDTAIQPIVNAGSGGPVFTSYQAVFSGFEFSKKIIV